MSLFENIETITKELQNWRLADVFRIIKFDGFETYRMHFHKRIEINYVKKGKCILYVENKPITFSEGEMMIINSNVSHSFEACAEGTVLMQLEFLPEILLSLHATKNNTESALLSSNIFTAENKVLKIVNNVRIMRAVQRIVNELTDKTHYYDYLVIMYYAELLVLIYRHVNELDFSITKNTKLKSAVYFIHTNYYNNITIPDIAAHVGVSERYLRTLFSNNTNKSPTDFLNNYRLKQANQMLKYTDLSVKEIAFRCGFKSPQYFSRIFKLTYGKTPKRSFLK